MDDWPEQRTLKLPRSSEKKREVSPIVALCHAPFLAASRRAVHACGGTAAEELAPRTTRQHVPPASATSTFVIMQMDGALWGLDAETLVVHRLAQLRYNVAPRLVVIRETIVIAQSSDSLCTVDGAEDDMEKPARASRREMALPRVPLGEHDEDDQTRTNWDLDTACQSAFEALFESEDDWMDAVATATSLDPNDRAATTTTSFQEEAATDGDCAALCVAGPSLVVLCSANDKILRWYV